MKLSKNKGGSSQSVGKKYGPLLSAGGPLQRSRRTRWCPVVGSLFPDSRPEADAKLQYSQRCELPVASRPTAASSSSSRVALTLRNFSPAIFPHFPPLPDLPPEATDLLSVSVTFGFVDSIYEWDHVVTCFSVTYFTWCNASRVIHGFIHGRGALPFYGLIPLHCVTYSIPKCNQYMRDQIYAKCCKDSKINIWEKSE